MKWPIGVFTRLDAGLGVHLDVVKELSIPTIQLRAPSKASRTDACADEITGTLESMELALTAVFGGFEGESYQSIPIVEQTVGLVPESTRASRLVEMKEISDFAKLIKCDVIALHLGFVPHDTNSEPYHQIVETTKNLCRHASNNGQNLHLETGQESADSLLQFIAETECTNLFVNFDPANMILYGTGDPIEAVKKLGKLVRSVHCKDAVWSDKPGQTWGRETPLGEGDVNFDSYLKALAEIGYEGPLTIEREIPQEPERQKAEIGRAAKLLEDLRPQFIESVR